MYGFPLLRRYFAIVCIVGTLQYSIANSLKSKQKIILFFDDGQHTTISLYTMDLDEENPDAAETRVPLPNHSILDVLQFTPVCVVCTICNRPITGNVRAVKLHMSKHYIIPDGTQFRIGNQLQLGMD